MPYEVIAPAATVLQSLGEWTDPDGKFVGHKNRAFVALKGRVLADDEVSPVIKDALDGADENDPVFRHVQDKIKKVSGGGRSSSDASEDG